LNQKKNEVVVPLHLVLLEKLVVEVQVIDEILLLQIQEVVIDEINRLNKE